MPRRIVTTQLQGSGGPQQIDTYFDRVIKYIPADVVAAWIAVTGLVSGAADVPVDTILWIAFGVSVVFTALWTYKQTQVPDKPPATTQILIATGAFIVWVFALGGPFTEMAFYRPIYGSLLLIFYSLFVGLVSPPES